MTDYWRKRIEKEQLAQKERDAQLGKEMSRLYQSHFADVTKEVKGFLERYADKNGLSYTEAMKRVEQFDVAAFQDKAKRYVETRDFSPQANRELALYNLKMKMNRLELLKANLTLALATLESDEMRLTNRFLNEEVRQTLKQQAGLLGRSVANQGNLQAVAQARINTPFEGATWSRRIWNRQSYLRQQVDAFTQDLVVRGVNPTTAIRKLRLTFNVTAHQAKRLAVTEGARVQTEVQREMLKRAGFEMVEYITEPSACPICGPHGDKHYRIDQLVPGLNAPPMHPFCRCSIAAWEDSAKSSLKSDENQSDALLRMTRNKDFNKRRPINIVRQNKLTRDFRDRGGYIWQDDEAERYLKSQKAAAMNLNAETIVLQRKPTISEVLEELYHAEQYRKGTLNPDDPISRINAEIEAQNYLLSVEKLYNIPRSEIEQTKQNLLYWQNELKEALKNEN